MKIFKKYISFSKLLVFTLVIAFFAITFFDGYIILRPLNMVENGVNLAYATVIGTIVSVMSTFANAVILFAIKGYLSKSAVENTVGYDAKTGTTSEEPNLDKCSGNFQRSTKYNRVYQKIPIFYFEDFAGLQRGDFIDLTDAERNDLINNFMITNNVDCQVGLVTQIEQDIKLPDIQLHNGTIVAKINTEIQPWTFKCSKYQ